MTTSSEGHLEIVASKKTNIRSRDHIFELIDRHASGLRKRSSSLKQLPGEDIINNIGSDWFHGAGDNDNIVYHLLKGLDVNLIAKLKACKVGVKDSLASDVEQWPEVLLIVDGESDRARDMLPRLPNKSIFIGAGYDDGQLEASGIDGRAVKNLWVPYSSMFFLEETGHSPMELMDRTHAIQSLASKTKELVYLQSNCVEHRESFWDAICESMIAQGKQCHYAGKCNGKMDKGTHYQAEAGHDGRWMPGAIATYAPFKIAVSMENKLNTYGYMTEKIVLPLLAGTIPVYSGAEQVTDVFEPEAFVRVDWQNQNVTFNVVQNLLEDSGMYERMVSRPAVSEDHFRRYFTWHSSTFAKYGDELRTRIIESILDYC
jgi:hypothetical protein